MGPDVTKLKFVPRDRLQIPALPILNRHLPHQRSRVQQGCPGQDSLEYLESLDSVTNSMAQRTFRPNYLSFSGTYQCNLSCPHCCVPIEWPDRLDIPTALRFLEDARQYGIDRVAFTGGEPFLYPEFLLAMCRRAVELKFRFDKIMTNGVWHADSDQLNSTLVSLSETGFSGKLGLSVDKFHGVRHTEKLAEFCRAARRIFRRDSIVSLSYASRSPETGLEPVRDLAEALGGVVEWSEMLGKHLLVSDELTMTLNWNHLAPVERAEKLAGGWDGTWFEEDYCEGPGQALIVTPKGEVKPCCGFASDLDQLTIGNIYRDTVSEIVQRARAHPFVGEVFRHGLTSIRDQILARNPDALPGAASNQCYFCWWILTRGLVDNVGGGGGQIGNWTGPRPNHAGELLQLGLPHREKAD